MTSTEPSSILAGPRQPSAADWFRELQAQAWEEFEAEPLPARTNELWRFSSVKNLSSMGMVAPEFSGDAPGYTRAREFVNPAGSIVFGNETLVTRNFSIRRSSGPESFSPPWLMRWKSTLTGCENISWHSLPGWDPQNLPPCTRRSFKPARSFGYRVASRFKLRSRFFIWFREIGRCFSAHLDYRRRQ